jgi:hypothetical protein
LDGSIEIKKPLSPIIDKVLEGNYDRLLMIHPKRNQIANEYATWIKFRGYPKENAIKAMTMMVQLGYDLNYKGLYETTFEVVRNNKLNNNINEITHSLLHYLGKDEETPERINQTIFSFVTNKLFSDKLKVLPVSESIITNSPYLSWYVHNSDVKIMEEKIIQPFLFNKPCELWDFSTIY